MPSFYPPPLPQSMPLTPPEQNGAYNSILPSAPIQSLTRSFFGHNGMENRYGSDGSDKHGYSKLSMQPSAGYSKDLDQLSMSSLLPRINYRDNMYGHLPSQTLPPMRVAPSLVEDEQVYYQARTHLKPQPKEEKAVGGVSAHLDYEMEHMVDFVSEMAQGMYDLYKHNICIADIDIVRSVQPGCTVTPAFRKYVSQILSSTRLPSSTILLGLHYLTTRMGMLSAHDSHAASSNQLYHLLTIALLLGSKFLDDNTFQNRSWYEVSNIPVADLNTLEMEWLVAIHWNLHIDQNDSQGFSAWLTLWSTWKLKRIERNLGSLRLNSLDTNMQGQRAINKSLPPTPMFPPLYSDSQFGRGSVDRGPPQWHTPRYDQWPLRSVIDHSPPSAPETGPNTPEWYGRHGSIGYGQSSAGYSARAMPPPPLQILPSAQSTYYNPYAQQYTPTWNSHGMGCGCGYCAPYHERYSMSHGFSAQTVAG